ncbi:ParB N-terminal domain-containing protein [Roseomonas aeriglobus]|nr:ParB N-terminal domain-containing protein [Roseomonas aeriglobus]
MNDVSRSRFTEAQIIQIDPAQCAPHPANRRDLVNAAEHIDKLKASIVQSGQLVPATVLAVRDEMYTVFGACRAEAIRQLRAEGHDIHLSVITIDGDLDLGALMIAAEQTSTRDWSQWERAELFDRLAADMSNGEIARQLDLAKSTVGRTRNVTALPEPFLLLVANKHEIEAESARRFNVAWATPEQKLILARHLAELLIVGERIDAHVLFASCSEALALAVEDASDNGEVVASDTAEAVNASLAHLHSVVREQRAEAGDDGDNADVVHDDFDTSSAEDRNDANRAARVERALEGGVRVVEIVLEDEDQVIGEAKRTRSGALIVTVDAVDQYPVDQVGAAITTALVRLFVN